MRENCMCFYTLATVTQFSKKIHVQRKSKIRNAVKYWHKFFPTNRKFSSAGLL